MTSMCRISGSTIATRVIFAGLKALVAKTTGSSENWMMSIFSPRNSRMIDCTRIPFMPTQAPTLSTSRSRLATAILVRSPASRAQPLNHHRAVVDLRHFLFKEPHHQIRRGAGYDHPGVLPGFFDALDHAAYTVADAEILGARLLLLRQARLGLADINDQIGPFHSLDTAIHQIPDAVGELGINRFAFSFADLLQDHLLGGLRRYSAESIGIEGIRTSEPITAAGSYLAAWERVISRSGSSTN